MIKGRQADQMMCAKLNNKGVTLVEVMVALVVLLFVSLAMMQTALVSVDSNMLNVLRDEAVSIAEMRMDQTRNIKFDAIADDSGILTSPRDCPTTLPDGSPFTTGERIQRNIRNIANKDFCTNLDETLIGLDNKQVTITVGWRWKERDYFYTISTMLRKTS